MRKRTDPRDPPLGHLPKGKIRACSRALRGTLLREPMRTAVSAALLLSPVPTCFAPAVRADTVALGRDGHADLSTFVCHDFERSRVVHRVCYDVVGHQLLLRLGRGYVAFCNVDGPTVVGLEGAASMGQYLSQHVKRTSLNCVSGDGANVSPAASPKRHGYPHR